MLQKVCNLFNKGLPKPTIYQVLFRTQKWRGEQERLSLYTHEVTFKGEVVKPVKEQASDHSKDDKNQSHTCKNS